MEYKLDEGIAVLERTPGVLTALLGGLPECWSRATEGGETWSAYDIVGHLIHGEQTDWMERIGIILKHGEQRAFTPFDRFAQFTESQGKTMDELLERFSALRSANLDALRELNLTHEQLDLPGMHPALGAVTLRNLLATWTAHDLGHIYQIARTMAAQYKHEVGPWIKYMRVLQESAA